MAAKHTPGPWYHTGNVENVGTDFLWCGQVQPLREPRRYVGDICNIQSCDHIQGITVDEAQANARLIAAAPDMLDACRQALLHFEDDQTISHVLAAAIAKAEGRS